MKVSGETVRMRKGTGFLSILALCLSLQVQAAASGEKGQARKTSGKHHVLKATKETVQWGWLDPNEPPKLTVNSGDTISIETMMHALDGIHPGVPMEEIVRLRKANPGGGPHSVTGPIFVTEAEPGELERDRAAGDAAADDDGVGRPHEDPAPRLIMRLMVASRTSSPCWFSTSCL